MRTHFTLLILLSSLFMPMSLHARDCRAMNEDDNINGWHNLNYLYNESTCIVYDFESEESLAGWVTIDNDNDDYNWQVADLGDAGHAMISQSYDNATYSPLTPDNWLISPAIAAGSKVKLDAWGRDPNYASEVFKVYAAPASYTSLDEFVALSDDITTGSEVATYEYELSAWQEDVCVAIRHYNVSDMFILCVDNFTVIPRDTPESITTTIISNKADDSWYNLAGMRLAGKPSVPGIYIHNGKKTVIK